MTGKRPRKIWTLVVLLVALPFFLIAGVDTYSKVERALFERRERGATVERLRVAQTIEAECEVYTSVLMRWAWENHTEVSVDGKLFYVHQAPHGIAAWVMLATGDLAPCHRRLRENEPVRREARAQVERLIGGAPFYPQSTREQLATAFAPLGKLTFQPWPETWGWE